MNPQNFDDTKVKIAARQFHEFQIWTSDISQYVWLKYTSISIDKFYSVIECKLFIRYESISGITFPILEYDVALQSCLVSSFY